MKVSFKSNLDKIVSYLLIVLMGIMVLNVTWQVVSRYIFQNPSSFTDELSRYMLIWLGMLGAAYVAGQDQHLAIDILPQKLVGKSKARLMIFIYSLVLAFSVLVMVLGGSNLVYITYILKQKSATLQLPLAYVYSIIPFSGLLISYYQIYQIRQQISLLKA
ncbi:TRAP transporter small permease [Cecembia rubra]|uniref:TRAP-type C4-dicarboxylate transport system permease small subunit n=1 Tax=Cecembia rubra TaxID=1485585 RepID=A0A2P8EDL6_9BACT|nr:TRAP transporter small permease [Cecembia rubra]PSL07586.1 TRAP-type C4-dicarboxylate transport system permease small subunit [Cecembia rubra]